MSLWSTTEKPKYLSDAEKALVAGVDTAEAAANNLNAGWVRIQEYTDAQGNSRRKSETLVAMGTIPTDGNTAITDDLAGGGGTNTYTTVDWQGDLTFSGMDNKLSLGYGSTWLGSLATDVETFVGSTIEFTAGGTTYTTTVDSVGTNPMSGLSINLVNLGWGMGASGVVTTFTIS